MRVVYRVLVLILLRMLGVVHLVICLFLISLICFELVFPLCVTVPFYHLFSGLFAFVIDCNHNRNRHFQMQCNQLHCKGNRNQWLLLRLNKFWENNIMYLRCGPHHMATDVLVIQHPVSGMDYLPILENLRQQRLYFLVHYSHWTNLVILNNVYI